MGCSGEKTGQYKHGLHCGKKDQVNRTRSGGEEGDTTHLTCRREGVEEQCNPTRHAAGRGVGNSATLLDTQEGDGDWGTV